MASLLVDEAHDINTVWGTIDAESKQRRKNVPKMNSCCAGNAGVVAPLAPWRPREKIVGSMLVSCVP